MGYTTEFIGQFDITPTLTEPHRIYLEAFQETRRMQRNAKAAEQLPDPQRLAVGLPIGVEGGYFVGGGGSFGQDGDDSILDYNDSPQNQPGLWCKWIPDKTGAHLKWSGAEKFYYYEEWLRYLIEHFLQPWGYVLNGDVEWEGEGQGDTGTLVVTNNQVKIKYG